ncbi:CHAT domain-containing protein [Leptothoe spongobia]|uniref:CHAT domain-containing protein n=1 Tax=Leptothoe spongobia TAU-MAC 1115 TaxID=1967444 RepID=A0A947DBT2_9CYAN|nr:CHAT domain-containing protein [Leptothoe spongobia]MBT9314310.1 CHAT domain-containing protein [Leptothoe spongobia TAU-MAC 1115]
MEVLPKATLALALLPIVSSGIAIADNVPLLAQSIVPTAPTTQITISDQDVIDISGGTPAANNIFHSFEQFNLAPGQTANFITPLNTDAVIGQVIGGNTSTIDGLLQLTGSHADLYLVNPAGLIFGPNARLDLRGSFTATTATHIGNDTEWFNVLSNPDYSTLVTAPSNFGFSRSSSVINHGQLTVPEGASIRFLAPQVTNTGTLTAPDGKVTLFTAERDQTIRIGQSGSLLSLEITAQNGTSDSLPAMITGGHIHHSNSLVISNDGEMALVTSEIPTEAQQSFNLSNSGNISTAGMTGGEIHLLGDTIQITDSTLDASGQTQGGSIRIGGDFQGKGSLPRASQTIITDTARLSADTIQGNGGEVIVWSDGSTLFSGSISAQSATGNGGLVETSGLHHLSIGNTATVNTMAPHGNSGLWLLDPTNLTLVDTNLVTEPVFKDINEALNSPTDNSLLSISTVTTALDSTNITLQAADSITIASPVDASSNNTDNNLLIDTTTLNLDAPITLTDEGKLSGTATTVNVGANGSIQNGIDAVAEGGNVNLAATTYREGNTITLDRSLILRGQGQDSTLISGDANNDGKGNHQVLSISNSGDNINLTNLTIQDGLSSSDGAGLSNDGKNTTISDVTFSNNQVTGTSQDGGAIHNRGSLSISNAVFDNNLTGSDGGAIDIQEGTVVITNSTFTNNQAGTHGGAIDVDPNGKLKVSNTNFSLNAAGTDGGAIYSEGAIIIDTVNFTNNNASETGGAVFLNGDSEIIASSFFNNMAQQGGGITNQGELNLLKSIITSNQSTGIRTDDGGGGIYNTSGGNLTIDTSLINNNISAATGGGILNFADKNETMVTISNSSIVGNQSSSLGGGIAIASQHSFSNLSQLNVINSTISGNQALTGGGIHTIGPTSLTNVTIAENIAISSGGGVSDNTATATEPSLINTIVAVNSAPLNPDVEGNFRDQGNNLIGINEGSNSFSVSALVGTISKPINAGLDSLKSVGSDLPAHQLLSNSLAANAGNNAVATTSDQNGQPRIIGNTIDIGAVESNILPTDPITPAPTSPLPAQQPVLPSSSQQSQPGNTLPNSLINLTDAVVLIQEEKTVQQLSFNSEQVSVTMPNGRLRYFDEEAFQYLEETFSKDFEKYWQLPQTQPVSLETVQQTLQQASNHHQTQSAVIYAVYVPSTESTENALDQFVLPRTKSDPKPEDQLLLILVPPTGKPIQHLIDVSRTELTQQAKLFRLAVSDPEDSESYRALARQMYGWLLAPLQPDLAKHQIDHVMYSLDQGLRAIPLAAMMQENSFVIEQYGISMIPSIGLTQPQFEHMPARQRSLIAGANYFQAFEELPAVTTELEIVAQNTQATDVLINETFTLDNFLALQASQQYDLLHLATHAEFNAGNLEQSFIQFWDSPLTFNRMRDLSWSELELLILSACGTALSSPEAELGFTGLAAGAGIETAMGSLWNVSDIGTLALMAEFYSQLPATPLRFHTLQKAQLSLIQGNTHIKNNILNTSQSAIELPTDWSLPSTAKFTHPFYWSGFTMVGNPWD